MLSEREIGFNPVDEGTSGERGEELGLEKGKLLGTGGNADVYEVVGDPEKVVKVFKKNWIREEDLPEILKEARERLEAYSDISEDVNIARLLDVWIEDDTLYELIERAPGREAHDRQASFDEYVDELRIIASASQGHYDKLIADVEALHGAGFSVDPSKPDNFFYDTDTGFYMIDAGLSDYKGSMQVPLIHSYNFFTKYKERLNLETVRYIRTILEKLERAGDPVDKYPNEQIVERLESLENKND